MHRSTDRILTTHVGSLIRPPKFLETLRAIEDKKPLPPGTYENALTESLAHMLGGSLEEARNAATQLHALIRGLWLNYMLNQLRQLCLSCP